MFYVLLYKSSRFSLLNWCVSKYCLLSTRKKKKKSTKGRYGTIVLLDCENVFLSEQNFGVWKKMQCCQKGKKLTSNNNCHNENLGMICYWTQQEAMVLHSFLTFLKDCCKFLHVWSSYVHKNLFAWAPLEWQKDVVIWTMYLASRRVYPWNLCWIWGKSCDWKLQCTGNGEEEYTIYPLLNGIPSRSYKRCSHDANLPYVVRGSHV